eukprot:403334790
MNKLVTTTKDEKRVCLVLEMAQGVDLVALLRANMIINERFVKIIIAQASHIFINQNLRIELIDLGLSEQIQDGSTSTPAGTYHSMSPEVANLFSKTLQNQEIIYPDDLVTLTSDLYSLGILMYELLANKPPFDYLLKPNEKSQQEKVDYLNMISEGVTQEQIEKLKLTYNEKNNLELSEECLDFIVKVLEKDPRKRLGNNKQFQDIWNHKYLSGNIIEGMTLRELAETLVKDKEYKVDQLLKQEFDDIIDLIELIGEYQDLDSIDNNLDDQQNDPFKDF